MLRRPTLQFDPASIKRAWNAKENIEYVIVNPGQLYVSDENIAIQTTLGSCISACVRDSQAKVGGLNHFMLPMTNDNITSSIVADSARYGNWAMEYLINEILKRGGKRRNLEVKIFGGSDILKTGAGVGNSNSKFALGYIHDENLNLIAQDTGGNLARIIVYYPMTGKVRVKHLAADTEIEAQENQYRDSISQQKPSGGEIELF